MSWYFFGGFSAYWTRAVGPPAEPLRMLLHVRMIGRALERDVERDLDAVRRGASRPGAGNPRACRAPDGSPCGRPPRRRSPTGCRRRRARASSALLRPLRALAADRMDRRQVEHVEAHLARRTAGAPRQSRNVPWRPGVVGGRAREELVPRARSARARGSTTTRSSSAMRVAKRRSG